jgi:hypothetical protein
MEIGTNNEKGQEKSMARAIQAYREHFTPHAGNKRSNIGKIQSQEGANETRARGIG